MLELYQFELSQYSEKVRFILDYKGLDYHKREVTPGVGQIEVFQLTGQRQVPVLRDGQEIIADSSAIARHLELRYPERPILPADPQQRALCWLIEEWADESLGVKSRRVALGALSQYPEFRTAMLPTNTPDMFKRLVENVPGDLINLVGLGMGAGPTGMRSARAAIEQNLEVLCTLLANRPYLVADQPTLADFAVAGLTMYLQIPAGPYLEIPETLQGQGVPDLINDPRYTSFFNWRRQLYTDFRKPLTATGPAPTSIAIE